MRSFGGMPSKIGGWESIDFSNGNTVTGAARSIFSSNFSGQVVTMIGTNTRLYALSGSVLENITPLKTSSTAAANSLSTLYGTLANDPITTTIGSKSIVIADTSASRFRAGDTYTIAGAADTGGIGAAEINVDHVIRSISGTNITVRVATTAATSSVSGGGASVVRKCGLLEIAKASHGLPDGDRVTLSGAAASGGISGVQINREFIIRVTASGTFDVMTVGTSTSSVSAAGGASTVYYPQIDAGQVDESYGQGYGMGKFGVGLYGTSLLSSTDITLVRTWFHSEKTFGDALIMTAGNQTGLYEWDGDTTVAPVLVTNAPSAINYAFVSDNIIVTLGASGVDNRIKTSDQGNRTNWTSSSTNSVYVDDIEGAGKFLSHITVSGVNLLFTANQTYTFRKIPRDSGVWEIKQKDPDIGIIGPMARVVVGGVGYWMGEYNFYMWRGGNIEIVPSNSTLQTTLHNYVFDNINRSQLSKCFAWHNKKFNEIWFHYPSSESNECDRVARLCLQDMSWWPDTFDRTAAEYPNTTLSYPRLISSDNTLYYHEKTANDDGAAMSWSLSSPDNALDKNHAFLEMLIPDSIQDGDISVNVKGRAYPQSTSFLHNKNYTVEESTEKIPCRHEARLWRYVITGSEIDQTWIMGQWFEMLRKGSPAP